MQKRSCYSVFCPVCDPEVYLMVSHLLNSKDVGSTCRRLRRDGWSRDGWSRDGWSRPPRGSCIEELSHSCPTQATELFKAGPDSCRFFCRVQSCSASCLLRNPKGQISHGIICKWSCGLIGFDLPQDTCCKSETRRLWPLAALQTSDCLICPT